MEQLATALREARSHDVLVPDDRSGPATQSPGVEVPSDAGAREPGDADHGARVSPRSHGGVMERTSGEVNENYAARELGGEVARHDAPTGYYWAMGASGNLELKTQPWFAVKIAAEADTIFGNMREKLSKDPDTLESVQVMADGLRAYLDERYKYNEMVVMRKLKQEADDACYQLCQAAKYYLDALERAQSGANRGQDMSDDQRIETLSDLSMKSATEGYVVAAAIFAAADEHIELNFAGAAKRVADYSARKLTEWYAARETATRDRVSTANNAALATIVNMFGKKGPTT
jgi:hypothetical protein